MRRSGLRRCERQRGHPIPPNTLAELQRDMAHQRFVGEQIKRIETTRQEQLKIAFGEIPSSLSDLST